MKTSYLLKAIRESSLLLAVGFVSLAFAQREPLPFIAAATDDKAYILLVGTPRRTEAFNVYRKGPADNTFTLLNRQPITGIVDPAGARQILGDEYRWVARVLRAEDEFDVVRRLKSDPGMSATLSLSSLNVARVAGRLFVDENVKQGTSYRYRVEFLDYARAVLNTAERDVLIKDRKPPAPRKVETKAGDSEVKISWDYPEYSGNPDDIVVGFNIYRKTGTGGFEKMNSEVILRQEELKYRNDVSAKNDEGYSYYVTAADFIGRESAPSETITASPRDLTPPESPRGTQLIPEEGKILITWEMNLELDLSHYDVYKSMAMHGEYKGINTAPITGDQPRFVDAAVYSGPDYYYKLKAIDKAGNESDFSTVVLGRPSDKTPPALPEGLTAKVSGRFVRLKWSAPQDRDLKGFHVYRHGVNEEFMRMTDLPQSRDTLVFNDEGYQGKGLVPGRSYTYGVASVDNASNESKKAEVRATIPDDEAPMPPLDSYVRHFGERFVEVSWQPSMSLDVQKYRVYRSEGDKKAVLIIETRGVASSAVDTTVTSGRRYLYQVAALDSSGNESKMTERTEIVPTDLVAPPAPENVKATATIRGVEISWNPVKVNDLLGYNVYRSALPNAPPTKLNDSPITKTQFSDPAGKAGQYYRITSLDTSGHENTKGRAAEAVQEKTPSPQRR
jgi:fibronectin type 3 domain-containing protein